VDASPPRICDLGGLGRLLGTLRKAGYALVAPVVRDGALVCSPIESIDDLPAGWTDTQEAGTYRLQHGDGPRLFGLTGGPVTWKRHLLPPRERLWRAERVDGHLRFVAEEATHRPTAFVGIRACDVAALARLDDVYGTDPGYAARRAGVLLVAVDCASPSATCFCASMGTGPTVAHADVVLTELTDPHRFVLRAGTSRGQELVAQVTTTVASPDDLAAAAHQADQAALAQQRAIDTDDLPALLARRAGSARWDDVAARCFACGSCTLVCPTCFCHTVEDTTDLTGTVAERWRLWDSCFTGAFSYLHGSGSVRSSTASRYRQWLTHKLGTWHDQFGVSGCVGCGRCITWCPAGIDITREAAALRELDAAVAGVRGAS
jgi:ferredoxin